MCPNSKHLFHNIFSAYHTSVDQRKFQNSCLFYFTACQSGKWDKKEKKEKKKKKKRKKMLFICLMLGNFRLQQGSMEFVSPSQNVLRRHAEWELVMRRGEAEEACIWQLGRHKRKQMILFVAKPLSWCTMDACYCWPALSILMHTGKYPLSTKLHRTMLRKHQLSSNSVLLSWGQQWRHLELSLNWEAAWGVGRSGAGCIAPIQLCSISQRKKKKKKK